MRYEEQLLTEALMAAGVPELPEPVSEDTPVWVYGIARILTTNLTTMYAIVRNSYGGSPLMLKAFGSGSMAKIESIHPYRFLDKKYVPSFESAAATKDFLAQVYGLDKMEVSKMKKETLLKLLYNYCIKKQIASERSDAAFEAAQKIKKARQAERNRNLNIKEEDDD